MGVGVYLLGSFETDPSAAAGEDGDVPASWRWLVRVSEWVEEHYAAHFEGARPAAGEHPGGVVTLFPWGEGLEIVVPQPGRAVVSATTSSVGPGYHVFVCDLLKRLGRELNIRWDPPGQDAGSRDDTGYFHTGDVAAVEAEMLRWLGGVVAQIRRLTEDGCSSIMVSLPLGHRYRADGAFLSPLGPRDVAWLERVIADPRAGTDLFPWWEQGVGPAFYFGRAMARVWRDVRWREPLDEGEDGVLLKVHHDLARAFRHRPDLSYPWREWNEILAHIDEHDAGLRSGVARRAAGASAPLVGYRRGPVDVDLINGWVITIPGELAEEWEGGNWRGWDHWRSVTFGLYAITEDDGSKTPAGRVLGRAGGPDGEVVDRKSGESPGVACLVRDDSDGEHPWRLETRSAADGELAVCTIAFRVADDREWALDVWRTLGKR